jgi:hypothetical protein
MIPFVKVNHMTIYIYQYLLYNPTCSMIISIQIIFALSILFKYKLVHLSNSTYHYIINKPMCYLCY